MKIYLASNAPCKDEVAKYIKQKMIGLTKRLISFYAVRDKKGGCHFLLEWIKTDENLHSNMERERTGNCS